VVVPSHTQLSWQRPTRVSVSPLPMMSVPERTVMPTAAKASEPPSAVLQLEHEPQGAAGPGAEQALWAHTRVQKDDAK